MTLKDRLKSKTPIFFIKLRNIGLILAAAGGAILTAPIGIPAGIITIAGYMTVAGSVASAVSQAVVTGEN